ncbi:hypothetical protein J6590_040361 [Homalodisca vitripennis]|nr:hypothetical protein J6590_040361 [Homalodisca vitripennis]
MFPRESTRIIQQVIFTSNPVLPTSVHWWRSPSCGSTVLGAALRRITDPLTCELLLILNLQLQLRQTTLPADKSERFSSTSRSVARSPDNNRLRPRLRQRTRDTKLQQRNS